MRPSFQVSDEQLALRAYVQGQPHGILLTFEQIEDATGVSMDTRGRQAFRAALVATERLFSSERNVGYHLIDKDGTFPMMRQSTEKIRKATRRAIAVGEKVEAQFAPDMDIEERKRLDLYLSHHGALDASLRNNIKQYGNPAKAVADTDHVELPPEIRALRHPA